MIYVKDATVQGRRVSIHLDKESGLFDIQADGGRFSGKSMEEVLREARVGLEKLPKPEKEKLSIEFLQLCYGSEVKRGTITGKHASTGHWLVTWEGGAKGQLTTYDLREAVIPYSGEAAQALEQWTAKIKALEAERGRFIEANHLVLPGQGRSK